MQSFDPEPALGLLPGDHGGGGYADTAALCEWLGCKALRGCPALWWASDAGLRAGAGEGPAFPLSETHAGASQRSCGWEGRLQVQGSHPSNAS